MYALVLGTGGVFSAVWLLLMLRDSNVAIGDFAELLASAAEADLFSRLRAAESIGRPLGDDRFVARIERLTRRRLRPGKRGPKSKREGN